MTAADAGDNNMRSAENEDNVKSAENEDIAMPADRSDTSGQTETKKLPVHSFFGHFLIFYYLSHQGGWIGYPALKPNYNFISSPVSFTGL